MRDLESIFNGSPVEVGSTSVGLLAASQRFEPAAWERLVEVYGPLVYSWARLSGLPPEDAKDIVQNVLRAVYCSVERFDVERDEGSFRGWLRTIANNKVVDRFRRESRQTQPLGGTDAQWRLNQVKARTDRAADERIFDGNSSPGRGEAKNSLQLAIKRVQREFSETAWRAFWGMTVDHRASAELADELNMTPAAVRMAKSRVLKRLRSALEEPH